MVGEEMLVVEDVTKDKRFANNPFLAERGVRFYAGAPLRTRDGRVVGSLYVIDTKPREVSQAERELLAARAVELMEAVESRAAGAPAEKSVLPSR